MRGAWEQALAADLPVVVELKVDPEVPPLPPHISGDQAKAPAKGDPERRGVIEKSIRRKLVELLRK